MRQLKINKIFTNRSDRSVNIYINELSGSKYDPISGEQESILAIRILEGDHQALNDLVNANLRFVISVAKQYRLDRHLMDLIDEGNLGMIKAAHKFDHKKGFKFISFAVWHVRQKIQTYLSNNEDIVRLPLNQKYSVNKIRKIENNLFMNLGRNPTPNEISEVFLDSDFAKKRNINDIGELLTIGKKTSSLDFNMGSDSDSTFTLLDTISMNKDSIEPLRSESLLIELNRYINTLDYRSKRIVNRFYGVNGEKKLTVKEISILEPAPATSHEFKHLGEERVRQILNNALKLIRNKSNKSNSILKEML